MSGHASPPCASARPESQERWGTLDVLRGLAIAGVIAVHSAQISPSGIAGLDELFLRGRVGVNLFFLVSAITMCFIWKQRERSAHPVRNFYISRFLRIAPLFWLAIPLYLWLNGLGASYEAPFGIGLREILLTASFLHGFWPESLNSVVPGDWSIAAEMTFYLVFPIAILTFRMQARAYIWLAIGVYLGNVCLFKPAAGSYFLAHYGVANAAFVEDSLHRFFLNQFPIFLTGCFLFFTPMDRLGWRDMALIALWIAAAFVAERAFATREFFYLLQNLALACFVTLSLAFAVRSQALEKLGQQSYAIYLIHFFVLHEVVAALPLRPGATSLVLQASLTLGISYFVAVAIHEFIEKPVHAFGKWLTSPESERRAGAALATDGV